MVQQTDTPETVATAGAVAWRLIAVCMLAQIATMAGVMFFPALLPQFQAEWALGNAEAGWVNGVFYAGYVAAVPFLVSATDRVDARRIFLGAALLGGLSMLGFAALAQGLWSASLFRFLSGISLAGTYMPGLKALTDRLGGGERSRAVALYTSCSGIGVAGSVFVAGWLSRWISWPEVALAVAGSYLVAFLLFLLAVPAREAAAVTVRRPRLPLAAVLANRGARGYMLAYAAHSWELFGFRSWLVGFLAFALGNGAAAGGLSPQTLATVVLLLGLPASVLGNEAGLRWGRRRVLTLSALASGGLGCLLGLATGLPAALLLLLALLYGGAIMLDSGGLTAGVIEAAAPGLGGATLAVHSFLGFSAGFLAPLGFGIVLDLAGGGVLGWGLAFASLGVVAMTGPVWLRWAAGDIEEERC